MIAPTAREVPESPEFSPASNETETRAAVAAARAGVTGDRGGASAVRPVRSRRAWCLHQRRCTGIWTSRLGGWIGHRSASPCRVSPPSPSVRRAAVCFPIAIAFHCYARRHALMPCCSATPSAFGSPRPVRDPRDIARSGGAPSRPSTPSFRPTWLSSRRLAPTSSITTKRYAPRSSKPSSGWPMTRRAG